MARQIININDNWIFSETKLDNLNNNFINLPHTWNGIDGQDGGNDYKKQTCYYYKKINKRDLPKYKFIYLEIKGANLVAEVYLNGKLLKIHENGYSSFYINLTYHFKKENILEIKVNNELNEKVYPNLADFTFYGGLYRDVNLILFDEAYFKPTQYGNLGIELKSYVNLNKEGLIKASYNIAGKADKIKAFILTKGKRKIANIEVIPSKNENTLNLKLNNVHLWNGIKDSYLYEVHFQLIKNKKIVDELIFNHGFRTFKVDSKNGFYLNGKHYLLRGVCRHQDRPLKGNALSKIDHEEDIRLILESGANTVRLAHYQQDQYFYDLCDKYGLIVWAEIPCISKYLAEGDKNVVLQLKELIYQNMHHSSICFWGLSNEITMNSPSSKNIIITHRKLNNLAHKIDDTRLTTMAVIGNCPIDDPYIKIPDLVSFNLYLGWYGGVMEQTGPWLDKYHKLYPNSCVGLSEYGCEALNWHTIKPVRGDYSEEYQALYHEVLCKQISKRNYLWATHVWNMFDFGSDRRNEGGEAGINHKGLVSFDRKYKKDSFYIFKAYFSKEKFIHICSSLMVDHVEDIVSLKIYTNLKEIEIFLNNKSLGFYRAKDHVVSVSIPNIGTSLIKAKYLDYQDEVTIRKVNKPNEDYILKDNKKVKNWFE